MELGVLNKIDRELNNSGNKNPDQNTHDENYEEKQNNGFSNFSPRSTSSLFSSSAILEYHN